ncbi:MAG: hypothetical protein JNJ83_22820 [Verrucomicrobiaceae bacterium]|nr:hypothetical protein [Verrucomicrobiaceae bacterium]
MKLNSLVTRCMVPAMWASAALGLFWTLSPAQAQTFETVFSDNQGKQPYAGLVQGSDGNFYGTTQIGGASGLGTVFKITAGGVQTVLHSFNGANGESPVAGLVQGADGSFYGTTSSGGANSAGTVFKISSSGTHTLLHHFSSATGFAPQAGLMQGSDGNFYGTTQYGGANSSGTVFKITASGTHTVLHSFHSATGSYPRTGLAEGNDGSFYGTTRDGGANGLGTVFKITPSGTHSVLHSFDSSFGRHPSGDLVKASDGTFYGTTEGYIGPGTVFRIMPGDFVNLVQTFQMSSGSRPSGRLALGSDGSIYGTSYEGGAMGQGTVFKLSGPTFGVSVLHSFSVTDGATPRGGLVFGSDGNLYGTTQFGGHSSSTGTVFKITTSGAHTVLHRFENPNGVGPNDGLVEGADGNFYGTTVNGGVSGWGVVFKVTSGGTHTVLRSFTDVSAGAYPQAGLVQGSDGSFYGTTQQGGTSIYGTVFKITADGTHTVLHRFNGTGGSKPEGGLVLGSDGDFYGTTVSGGANGNGTVFKITAGGTHTLLHSFNGTDGREVRAGLVLGSDGSFYGTTHQGGANGQGTVYKITSSGTHTLLFSFSSILGRNPQAGLVLGSDGSFYGTTEQGGANGKGTVFKITANGMHTLLHSFNTADGSSPVTGLAQGDDGSFYGTTKRGGASDSGTLFKITSSGTHTVLHSFDGVGAAYPASTPLFGTDGNIYGTASQMAIWRWRKTLGLAPVATTLTANPVGMTGATLNGTVNPGGLATTAQFEYGTSTSYGSTASVTLSPDDDSTAQNVSAVLSGLTPGTTYHYRLTASNAQANKRGADMTFTTVSNTPPTLSLPTSPVIAEATSGAGATVTFTVTANDAEDGPLTPTISAASGSLFAVGDTTVNVSATDSMGGNTTGSFVVRVQDTTPPTLQAPVGGFTPLMVTPSSALPDYAAQVVSYDAVGIITVVQTPAAATTYNGDPLVVTLSASDTAGNPSNVLTINITSANAKPVAEDDFITFLGSTTTFNPLSNDADPNNDILTIIDVGDPSTGTVTFTGNSITYTKDGATFDDQDGFTYTVSDGKGGEDTAVVIVASYNGLAGTYTGLLDDGTGTADGIFRATVASNGNLTGRAVMNGRVFGLSGRLDSTGAESLVSAGATFEVQTIPAGSDIGEPRQHLTVVAVEAGQTYTGNAIAHLYGARAPVDPAGVGYYHTAQIAQTGQTGLPASPGWMRMLVAKSGAVTVSGRGPDTLPVSCATAIVEGGQVMVYANGLQTNPATEYAGILGITLGGGVTGVMKFNKLPQTATKGALHATGFSGNYDLVGGKYTKAAVGTRALTTNGAGQVNATLTGAGYASPTTATLTLSVANAFTPLPSPPLTLLRLNASGQLTGTVKSLTNTNMAITGLIVPGLSGTADLQAIGCYLYAKDAYEGGEIRVIAAP